MTKRIDLINRRYGRWTVLSLSEERGNRNQIYWNCKCDCGRLRSLSGENLRQGHTNSCGCLKRALHARDRHQRAIERFEEGKFTWYQDKKGYTFGCSIVHPLGNANGKFFRHWHNFWVENNKAQWVIQLKEMGATLHHKNGIRSDNSPTNLELRLSGRHPVGWTIDDMLNLLKDMGYKIIAPKFIE